MSPTDLAKTVIISVAIPTGES